MAVHGFMDSLEKNVPENNISNIWKEKVKMLLEHKKDFFYGEAQRRGMKNLALLWEEYKERVSRV